MTLRKIIDWAAAEADGDCFGTIVSPFYEYYDVSGQYTYSCDVDIGEEEPLRNVPVATSNRDIIYAEVGMPVALKKMGPSKYAIVGLSKKVHGNTHILYMTFDDSFGTIINTTIIGNVFRLLTYTEIGTTGLGYGDIAYGARGKFDYEGNLVEIIRSY